MATLLPTQAAGVILAWDANPEPDIAGYRIYQSQQSGVYDPQAPAAETGTETTVTLGDLQYGETYYFVATAFNTSGLESDYSNEIAFTVTARPDPLTLEPPVYDGGFVKLTWAASDSLDLKGYKIYFSTTPGVYDLTAPALKIGTQTEAHLKDGLQHGNTYYFIVIPFTKDNVDGTASNEVSLEYSNAPAQPSLRIRLAP